MAFTQGSSVAWADIRNLYDRVNAERHRLLSESVSARAISPKQGDPVAAATVSGLKTLTAGAISGNTFARNDLSSTLSSINALAAASVGTLLTATQLQSLKTHLDTIQAYNPSVTVGTAQTFNAFGFYAAFKAGCVGTFNSRFSHVDGTFFNAFTAANGTFFNAFTAANGTFFNAFTSSCGSFGARNGTFGSPNGSFEGNGTFCPSGFSFDFSFGNYRITSNGTYAFRCTSGYFSSFCSSGYAFRCTASFFSAFCSSGYTFRCSSGFAFRCSSGYFSSFCSSAFYSAFHRNSQTINRTFFNAFFSGFHGTFGARFGTFGLVNGTFGLVNGTFGVRYGTFELVYGTFGTRFGTFAVGCWANYFNNYCLTVCGTFYHSGNSGFCSSGFYSGFCSASYFNAFCSASFFDAFGARNTTVFNAFGARNTTVFNAFGARNTTVFNAFGARNTTVFNAFGSTGTFNSQFLSDCPSAFYSSHIYNFSGFHSAFCPAEFCTTFNAASFFNTL